MQKFQIQTSENYKITCTEFKADPSSTKTLIIASATGVSQSYYESFAKFISSNNINVYTFDYCGIGESLNSPIKKVKTSASDWAKIDLEAVIQFCLTKHSTHKITLLGHSIGGQMIGLAPSSTKADRIILVAAQSGYWKFWKGFGKLRMLANWYILFPILTNIFGYLPSEKVSAMKNLPKNVALEWRKWCVTKNYLFDYFSKSELFYSSINSKITSYSVSDDNYAPKEAVDWLANKFENCTMERIHLVPSDLDQNHIGHFGFFKKKLKNNFWIAVLQQINNSTQH